MMVESTQLEATDLISLFNTIPDNEYWGNNHYKCLVGYPIYHGQLREEYSAYLASDCLTGAPPEWEWLAKRYNTSEKVLREVYYAVADFLPVRDNLDSAITFAELMLVYEYSFEDAVKVMDLHEESLDNYDDSYEDDDDDDDEFCG